MYNVRHYGAMIDDEIRMQAYADALKQVLTPESVVLDIGTGTGAFALLAARFGAGTVYAIEPSDCIQVGQQAARANGLSDRIHFIQGTSERATLPEAADILISDLRGSLPLFERNILSIADARTRLLKPGGTIIAESDQLYVAITGHEEAFMRAVRPWSTPRFDLDLSSGHNFVVNSTWKADRDSLLLLSEGGCWGTIDYSMVTSPELTGQTSLTVNQSGTGHGLVLWFDCQTAPGFQFTTAPGAGARIYGNMFMPWPRPLDLSVGDRVDISITASFVNDAYIFAWETQVRESSSAAAGLAKFTQSTFYGEPFSEHDLDRCAHDHRPQLNEDGRIASFVLEKMTGGRSLAEISHQLAHHYPQRFPDWNAALDHVAKLSRHFSR